MIPNTPSYPQMRDFVPTLAPSRPTHDKVPVAEVRWPVAVLGVPFAPLDTTEAIAAIREMIRSRRAHQIVTANVDFLVQANRDVELRRIFLDADLVLCDGAPVRWASRWLGNALPARVAGADLVPALFSSAIGRGLRVFLLGAGPGVAAEAAVQIGVRWPEVRVVGTFCPAFGSLLEMNHDEIIREVRSARPDVLLVAFGCPKQEKWIAMHLRALGVPVVIGVGATIDFLAGRVRRAPEWMQRHGLEWLFRLAQEPARLHRRYRTNLREFFPAVLRELHALRTAARHSDESMPPSLHFTGAALAVSAGSALTRTALDQHARFWRHSLPHDVGCVLDASAVHTVDSTGLAFLLDWRRQLRAHDARLVLLEPSRPLREALAAARLLDAFTIARSPVEAEQWITGVRDEPPVTCDTSAGLLRWHGDVHVGNSRSVWRLTLQHLFALGLRRSAVVIDLAEVRFIDSSAAALMLRLKEAAREQFGYEALFIGARPDVQNVLHHAGIAPALLTSA
jgi:N-acetylglucosaminyldiphosphoundecaprenol N-acetyl-beta-D-mannosaminyltransferase